MKICTLLLAGLLIYFKGLAQLPSITNFTPAVASKNMTVTINGINFTSATAVRFGSMPAASFTIVSDTQIKAVVGTATSGNVQVINTSGNAVLSGFNYVTTSGIFTDFGGYWPSSITAANTTAPDSSHNLLAFTYNGITYSTGVNDALLTSRGVNHTTGHYKALPIAGISGNSTAGSSTYLALAKKVDGSATVAYTPAVSSFSVKTVLTDGVNGLDLGTGITNLPASAVLSIQIFNINPTKITDNEPDIILTQIADPSSGNDEFNFIDAAGNMVGNKITQNMNLLPSFGNYGLDLYNLTPSTPYNVATAYNPYQANVSREIRLVAFRLSDFGITPENVSQIRGLKLSPSGSSDYAFIGYNVNAINLSPSVVKDEANSIVAVCSGGRARMTVIGSPASGGALSYTWQESANGSTWTTITNGGNYSGATTNQLFVTNPANGYQYRAVVSELNNASTATSGSFTISIIAAPAAPTAVVIAGPNSFCLNTPTQLTSTVTGGSNHYYQWENDASGTYQDIPGANLMNIQPIINQTGTISYRVRVSSGSGCVPSLTSDPIAVTVSGVSSITPAQSCSSAALTLSATATSGTLSWYASETTTTVAGTGTTFTTPVLNATTTYYVAASGCPDALRVPVRASIHPQAVGGTVSGSNTVYFGNNSTTLTLTGSTGTIVKWQSSTDNFSANINDIANSTNQLQVSNITKSTDYRVLLQSGSCSNAFSSPARLIVAAVVLPVRKGSLTAVKEGNAVKVSWKAYNQVSTARFEIERASDGVVFGKVFTVAPTAAGESAYEWKDRTPLSGYNYYRVKEVLEDGTSSYTNIIKVKIEEGKSSLIIYPNPVADRIINVELKNQQVGPYRIRVVNGAGQTVLEEKGMSNSTNSIRTLRLPQSASAGIYRLVVEDSRGASMNTTLLVN
jgi:hypothetical protein